MGKLNTVQNGKGSKSRISNFKKFSDNYTDINWGENNICPYCKQEVDLEVCWCGDYMKNHDPYYCGHMPVPLGCVCGYDSL